MNKSHKYINWYLKLIRTAQQNPSTEFTEKHHVFPRALFPGKQNKSVVKLTPRQHFIAHRIIHKIYVCRYGDDHPKTSKALKAIAMMVPNRKEYYNSRMHDISRKAMSDSMKANHHKPMKGRKFTEEHRKNLSNALKGSNNPMFGKSLSGPLNGMYGKKIENTFNYKAQYKVTYDDGREEIITGIVDWCKEREFLMQSARRKYKNGLSYKGTVSLDKIKGKTMNPRSKEHCDNISQAKKGHITSKETKKKISDAGIGRKQTDKQKEIARKANSCQWKLTYPDGRIEIIENFSAWCKERKIDGGNLIRQGKTKGIEVKAEKIN